MDTLFRRLIVVAPYIALIVFGVVYRLADKEAIASEAIIRATLVASNARADSLASVADSLRHKMARDTLIFWRTKKVVDTLTLTVDAWKHDTVKVVEYVEKADSTIRACTTVVNTCQAQLRVAEQRIDDAKIKADMYKKQIPTIKSRLMRSTRDMLIGAGISLLIK